MHHIPSAARRSGRVPAARTPDVWTENRAARARCAGLPCRPDGTGLDETRERDRGYGTQTPRCRGRIGSLRQLKN